MARPRKPTAHLASWRSNLPDRKNELELPAAVRCPAELKGAARKAWDRSIKPILDQGILSDADYDAAIALCQAWSRYKEAIDAMEAEGKVIEGKYGPVCNPWLKVAREALAEYLKIAPQFGIMPANRSRVSAATEQGKLDKSKGRFFAPRIAK